MRLPTVDLGSKEAPSMVARACEELEACFLGTAGRSWHPVARSADVGPADPAGVTLLDRWAEEER